MLATYFCLSLKQQQVNENKQIAYYLLKIFKYHSNKALKSQKGPANEFKMQKYTFKVDIHT
jgi:hypothetical protein